MTTPIAPGSVPVSQKQAQQAQAGKPERKRLKVEPEPAGQLEQLLVEWNKAKDESDVAKEREADLKGQIKAWILSLFDDPRALPGAFDITGDPHGRYGALTMTLKGGKRVDTEQMKQEGVYERYAKETTPAWELRESTPGRRR